LPEDLALAAIRNVIDEHGERPTADSWTAAGMCPSEKTIRNRFGSFRAAAEAAESAMSQPTHRSVTRAC
jgi:hypothetical protein